ncbi:hypothetical protein [Chryseobacterium rhizosphaerae]|uniref:hypothetical protein n=1 Tax=Chryseobacterium rhizosphaerae TaxID=395937 RepID=UPI003D11B827
MEELELLKKDWNKESEEFKEYSENEIDGMMKHKSVSMTKNLLIIGLIEIVLWTFYGYMNGQFPYIRMVLFFAFMTGIIFLFRKMTAGQNSITLMKAILNLRKLVLSYACISLLLAIVDSVIHFEHNTKEVMAGFKDGWGRSSSVEKLSTDPGIMVPGWGNYLVFGICLLIVFYLLYAIYNRTYGKILKNLRKNYKELSLQEEKAI